MLLDSLLVVTAIGLAIGFTAFFAGTFFLSIYTKSDEVIRLGMERISVICTTYCLCGIMEVLVGSMRGIGHSVLPMLVSVGGVCGLRIVYIFTFFAAHRTLFNLYLSYPISWIVTILAHTVCLIFARRKEFRRMGRARSRGERGGIAGRRPGGNGGRSGDTGGRGENGAARRRTGRGRTKLKRGKNGRP